MNVLVTGACGQLGSEMRLVAGKSSDNYIFTDVSDFGNPEITKLDITDRKAVSALVKDLGINAIVNCAAYTAVDAAESDFDKAELLNAEAPLNLALAMKEADGILIHISTDYVFGKEAYNTPCTEDRVGTPTGVYGLTKLHGEQKIAESGCHHIIIRTAWLYSEYGRNFCKTILSASSSKPELKVVIDQVGTPTYALDLANAIYKILSDRSFEGNDGIYHYSGEGVCSWYDFAKAIVEISGNTFCNVLPCRSEEFPSPVKRPSYSVLDKSRIKRTFGVEVPYWTASLKKCIENIKNG